MADPTYGTRTCQLCKAAGRPAEVPAGDYGHHLTRAHQPEEYPGGIDGLYRALLASLDQSIRESAGFPEHQAGHRQAQANIRAMWAQSRRHASRGN